MVMRSFTIMPLGTIENQLCCTAWTSPTTRHRLAANRAPGAAVREGSGAARGVGAARRLVAPGRLDLGQGAQGAQAGGARGRHLGCTAHPRASQRTVVRRHHVRRATQAGQERNSGHGEDSDDFRPRRRVQGGRPAARGLRVGVRRRRSGDREGRRHQRAAHRAQRPRGARREASQSEQAPEAAGHHRRLVHRRR